MFAKLLEQCPLQRLSVDRSRLWMLIEDSGVIFLYMCVGYNDQMGEISIAPSQMNFYMGNNLF